MQNKIATALAKAVLKPRNRAIHENGVRSALLKPDPCFPNPLNLHQELYPGPVDYPKPNCCPGYLRLPAVRLRLW